MANICSVNLRIDGPSRRIKDFIAKTVTLGAFGYDLEFNLEGANIFSTSGLSDTLSMSEPGEMVRSINVYGETKWSVQKDAALNFFKQYPDLVVYIDYDEMGNDYIGRATIRDNTYTDEEFSTEKYDDYDEEENEQCKSELIFDDNPNNEPIPEDDGAPELSLFAKQILKGNFVAATKLAASKTFDIYKKVDGWLPVQWALDAGQTELAMNIMPKLHSLDVSDKEILTGTALIRGFNTGDYSFYLHTLKNLGRQELCEKINETASRLGYGYVRTTNPASADFMDAHINLLDLENNLNEQEINSLNDRFHCFVLQHKPELSRLFDTLSSECTNNRLGMAGATALECNNKELCDLTLARLSFAPFNKSHLDVYSKVQAAISRSRDDNISERLDYYYSLDGLMDTFKDLIYGKIPASELDGRNFRFPVTVHEFIEAYDLKKMSTNASAQLVDDLPEHTVRSRKL